VPDPVPAPQPAATEAATPSGRTRVLHVLGPSTGGIRRHVGALVAALSARGWDIEVAGPAGVLEGIRPLDVVVDIPTNLAPVRLAGAWRQLRRAVRGMDLVHAHGLKAGWLAVVAARARRHPPPVVVTVHNIILDETSGRSARIMRVLERRVFKEADALVAVSPEVGGYVQQHTSRPVRVIRPVGPPPEARRDRDQVRERLGVAVGQPLVVCVARLHPQKGLSTLIEATALMVSAGVRLRVAIIGEGPLSGELTDDIRARGLGGTVLLAGPSDNAPDELAAADVVVIPSVWESGPLVLAEALVLCRPVVATPVGLVPEVIREGVSGRIVPIGDARALAAAVSAMLADPAAAERMAEAGREAVDEVWGAGALVDATEELYRDLLRSA
jgi:glycosyltransferase involved in cell wall biosynthesis